MLVLGPGSAQAQEETPDLKTLSLADLGYRDFQLRGLLSEASAFVPFPSNWHLQGSEIRVDITYIASPLLIQDRSTLTVLANNLEVISIVPVADGEEHTFSIFLPTERL